MKKFVYLFNEGNKDMKELLGGKGANLAEMTNLGLPIPEGFTITTEACLDYYNNNEKINNKIVKEIIKTMNKLEKIKGKKFGDINNPLLVSVRSGARASMPGMMDTILNLGLNDSSVVGFAKITNNPRFAYDSYRRFIQMYSDVVMEIDKSLFEKIIDEKKRELNIIKDQDLDVEDLKDLIIRFKKLYKEKTKEDFPEDVNEQLIGAVKAVFRSWNNERAIVYRKMNDIPASWGTAVNVQVMVFGNMNNSSGTGVAFTRNPATGEKGIYGEYLINAQGEDVVAGIRTPEPITKLKEDMPKCYEEFISIANMLEKHYKDMQDMEFTIEEGKLYILQTRNGKRTAEASINIACDLVNEKLINEKEALLRIDTKNLDQLLHPTFDKEDMSKKDVIGVGLPASPGAGSGKVVFSANEAKRLGKGGLGEKVILVRLETTPEDIEGMKASEGLLTVRGGITSHAAVVARGMGTCCVAGCSDIIINEEEKTFSLGNITFKEGDYISLDGATGNIYKGEIKTSDSILSDNFKKIMNWADKYRKLGVRCNADTPKDVIKSLSLGAEGIGLCRTEHMFFEKDRIPKIRKMILSETKEERENALKELIPYQKNDFKEMYKELKGLPMTVRYLDPPLHEFLPTTESDIEIMAKEMNISKEEVIKKCNELKEVNPMMGHRGCRLTVTYPEIAIMQTRALIEAAIEVNNEFNYNIEPEIMIPLITDVKELRYIKNIVIDEINKIKKEKNSKINYHIGTMIEVPRAALLADEIAKEVDFFSFGTNDLTQMTFGFSRDDAGKFLNSYYQNNIYENDPFVKLDTKGVGKLIELAVDKGKKVNPNIKLGICGEHAGEPSSIEFCHNVNLTYVSCSPYRVPIAKLSLAIASLKEKNINH